ncbi:MAG: CubicO group peptidase (beta-lactamase class C family) [Planctomycetota bacterium]|jgi:CubicO group peptidase (beta-lactamase class C family)
MFPFLIPLLASALLFSPSQSPEASEARFPASTALAEELSPESLAALDDLVQGFVDKEEVVGAELLVIKNGRTVLHNAYGWRDREAEKQMETGSVFCVRSMTKPFIAAAIMMLVESKQIKLSDPVSKHLPFMDVERLREITIQQMLNHTSGLPLSLIMMEDPRQLKSIQAVAALSAECELEFEPGTSFNYSDQGTDTLTALVEVVSGIPIEDFITTRLLNPLGMNDSTCLMTEGHPLRERGCSKYIGGTGGWTPFWTAEDEALFPIFLGSQALYSTLEDYARFTDMWRRKGRVGKERILKSGSVRKVLKPGPHPMPGATALPGCGTAYGSLMQLWTPAEEETTEGSSDKKKLVAFGHTGSDGTHAWVFPEQDAMVFYFTQSRGTTTGLQVEEVLGDLLLGVPFDPNKAAPPFEPYLGYYWEGEGDLYRAIVRDGEDLALEIIGKAVVPLGYLGGDRWKLRPNPSLVIEFDRDADGQVSGYHIGDHQEFRVPSTLSLASPQEIAKGITEAHHIERLADLGAVRLSGTITIVKQGIEGTADLTMHWPDSFRWENELGGNFEKAAFDGKQTWSVSTMQELAAVEGLHATDIRSGSPFVRYGDWLSLYPDLEVIQQLTKGSRKVHIVRTGGTQAPATTMYVDFETGKLLGADSVTMIPGAGRMGRRLRFGEYQDVGGSLLPFRTEIEFSNPMIGTIISEFTEVKMDLELAEGTFQLTD